MFSAQLSSGRIVRRKSYGFKDDRDKVVAGDCKSRNGMISGSRNPDDEKHTTAIDARDTDTPIEWNAQAGLDATTAQSVRNADVL
jgi:hypothetical protein